MSSGIITIPPVSNPLLKEYYPEKKYGSIPVQNQMIKKARIAAAQAYMCEPSNIPSNFSEFVKNLAEVILKSLPSGIEKQTQWEMSFYQIASPIIQPYISIHGNICKTLQITPSLDNPKKVYEKLEIISSEQDVIQSPKQNEKEITGKPKFTVDQHQRILEVLHMITCSLPIDIHTREDWEEELIAISEMVLKKYTSLVQLGLRYKVHDDSDDEPTSPVPKKSFQELLTGSKETSA